MVVVCLILSLFECLLGDGYVASIPLRWKVKCLVFWSKRRRREMNSSFCFYFKYKIDISSFFSIFYTVCAEYEGIYM